MGHIEKRQQQSPCYLRARCRPRQTVSIPVMWNSMLWLGMYISGIASKNTKLLCDCDAWILNVDNNHICPHWWFCVCTNIFRGTQSLTCHNVSKRLEDGHITRKPLEYLCMTVFCSHHVVKRIGSMAESSPGRSIFYVLSCDVPISINVFSESCQTVVGEAMLDVIIVHLWRARVSNSLAIINLYLWRVRDWRFHVSLSMSVFNKVFTLDSKNHELSKQCGILTITICATRTVKLSQSYCVSKSTVCFATPRASKSVKDRIVNWSCVFWVVLLWH